MKKNRAAMIVLQFCFIIYCPIYAQKAIDYDQLDAYIANAVKESRAPGFAVGIIKDDQIVFAKGYGVRSVESKIPNRHRADVSEGASALFHFRGDFFGDMCRRYVSPFP